MITTGHAAALVATMSLVTVVLRFLPFWIWGGKTKTPKYILYLGKVLPPAIIGMLVIYCLRNVSFVAKPFAIPELLAVVAVAFLQAWKKNSLLSILGGTVLYMLLVQWIF